MTARVLCFALLSLLVSVPCVAAPAPLPKPGRGGAEVVFDAGSVERVRLALLCLRSDSFARRVASDPKVAKLLPAFSEDERRGWLRKRLRVTADGGRVRVWIEGEGTALAILRAAADRLTGADDEELVVDRQGKVRRVEVTPEARRRNAVCLKEEYGRRLAQMKRLNEKGRRLPDDALRETEAQWGLCQFESDPLKLCAEPRLVRRR